MKKKKTDNKLRLSEIGPIYKLLIDRISNCKTTKGGIIKFPDVFSSLASFTIKKKPHGWDLLYFLKEEGEIEIIFGHGIKILKGGLD